MSKQNFMNTVEVTVPDSNTFDLSHDKKMSTRFGRLTPVLTMEVMPGDNVRITPSVLTRMAAMLFPVMAHINVFIHFFYVPNRVVWPKWKKFISGVSGIVPPYFEGTDAKPFKVDNGSIWDFLDLPTTTNIKEKILAFPYLAYLRIINEYYQDQNNDSTYTVLRDKLEELSLMDGLILAEDILDEPTALYENLPFYYRAYAFDYFTSLLPTAQKGPSVSIPVTLDDLPVEITNAQKFLGGDTGINGPINSDGTNSGILYQTGTPNEAVKLTGLAFGDTASLTGTINQLRASYALQRFYEKNMRGGTRYNETIKNRWGVETGDARINRPEYIGGIKDNVVISEVLQTSSTSETGALGQYAGHGTALASGEGVQYYAKEHGYIMGIMSIIPKTGYFQGIHKKHTRLSLMDWYQPEFAHLGEQEVKNKELFYDPSNPAMNNTLGYLPMGAEFKTLYSSVHGDFRDTLLPWHLDRKFEDLPNLNEEFIYCLGTAENRIFAVTSPEFDNLYTHIHFDIEASRKVPYYSTPI